MVTSGQPEAEACVDSKYFVYFGLPKTPDRPRRIWDEFTLVMATSDLLEYPANQPRYLTRLLFITHHFSLYGNAVGNFGVTVKT